MGPDWRELRIDEVAEVIGGGTPSTKDEGNFGGDIPWLTPKDLSDYQYRYISRGARNISEQGLSGSGARLLPKGSVLLTSRAPVGYVAIAADPVTTNQGFRSLIPRDGHSAEFLYYLLKANTAHLVAHATGTTFAELSGSTLRGLKFTFPPPREQQAIASILGSLDDKIELNRRTNATLEEIARTLFKSWFVDFDPVRVKMEGRPPPGMDAETASLFPDSFEDSVLGPVPEGWQVGTLGDHLELSYGRALKEEVRAPGPIPVYGSNGQIGWHSEALVIGPGIVVGRKGNPGIVTWCATSFFPIDTTFYVTPLNPTTSRLFLYHLLKLQDLTALNSDSAVPGLNRNAAYTRRVIWPSAQTIAAFDQVVEPFFSAAHARTLESHTLSTIRDTLLPKLLSGEIQLEPQHTGATAS
jgi:type I restriction enzyme, S subunit